MNGFSELEQEISEEIISDLKTKFNNFIENQKDIPEEYVDIINKNFWDLL